MRTFNLFMAVCVASLMSFSAFASAGYWGSYGWPGEYPTGFATTASITVPASTNPNFSRPQRDSFCEIPAGRVIHPFTAKPENEAKFYFVSPIKVYEALIDLELESVAVKKGGKVAVLRYLSEGYCEISINDGGSQESLCVGSSEVEEGKFKDLTPDVDLAEEGVLYFKTACLNGNGWVAVQDLYGADGEELLPGLEPATILDYGLVQE